MNGNEAGNPFSDQQIKWLESKFLSMKSITDLAFNITAGFEGTSYSGVQTYDSGLLTFGRFGFTLASGSLITLIDNYIIFRGEYTEDFEKYIDQLHSHDIELRVDESFLKLLRESGKDPDMQRVQNDLAFVKYYNPAMNKSVYSRGLVMPISMCFAFDCAINHGIGHPFFTDAEDRLKIPHHSRIIETHTDERIFIEYAAKARLDAMTLFAKAHNLNGVKKRAEFWYNRVLAKDWYLRGDNGNLTLKPGLILKV